MNRRLDRTTCKRSPTVISRKVIFKAAKITHFIFLDLCHLFTRCNRSVSYPAPTYYAHLVAARGKQYIVAQRLDMQNLQREQNLRQIQPNIVNNCPMFFV